MNTNSSTSASAFDSIEIFNAIYEEQQELEALRREMASRYEKEGEALEPVPYESVTASEPEVPFQDKQPDDLIVSEGDLVQEI